jgi:hypothetical protein
MRINVAIPEAHVKKPVLDAALEAVTRLNEDLISSGKSPTSRQLIAKGARWQPEKPGDEHFDHGALINSRGHGDCDDWAPLHAATLRVTGEDPGAKAIVRKSGPKRWHAIVQRSNGTIDDPSLAAGMPGPGTPGVMGAALPMMAAPQQSNVSGSFIATPHLALRPVADRHGTIESWQARADLPWHWRPTGSPSDLAMVTLHQSPVSSQAVVGALRGAWHLGMASDGPPDQLRRVAALADACEGWPYEELAERYGQEHAEAAAQIVGSFFGKVLKVVKKAANPFDLARSVVKAVPGVGPIAAKAMGRVLPTTANLIKYGPAAASMLPGLGPLVGPLASKALAMASPALKRSVARAQHLPPEQRAPALARTPIRHVSPPSLSLARTPIRHVSSPSLSIARTQAPGPVIVRPQEPNVELLNTFADRLQRAYEFGQPQGAWPR